MELMGGGWEVFLFVFSIDETCLVVGSWKLEAAARWQCPSSRCRACAQPLMGSKSHTLYSYEYEANYDAGSWVGSRA